MALSEVRRIDNMEQWNTLASELRAAGYTIWQMQYSARQPEGFHVWFWSKGLDDIEVVSHNRDVEKAIVKYKP